MNTSGNLKRPGSRAMMQRTSRTTMAVKRRRKLKRWYGKVTMAWSSIITLRTKIITLNNTIQ